MEVGHMPMELAVARAIMQARQVERALHDHGPWSIKVADVAYPAVRWILDDRIIFRVHLPDVCWLDEDAEQQVELLCAGEVAGTRTVELVDGECALDWMFVLPALEPARA